MWYTEHKKYDHGVPGLLIFKNQRTNTIGEQEIHVLSKHSKLSVGIRHPLARFFVLAPNQCNSGTHVYIIGLCKKPKGTLGQKFFSARCVTSLIAWMSQWTLSQHSVLVKLGCSVQGSSWIFSGFNTDSNYSESFKTLVMLRYAGVSNSNYSEGRMRTCRVTRGPHNPRYILKW